MKVKRVYIATGGTIGHIKPAAIVANALSEKGYSVRFITTRRNFHEMMVKHEVNITFIESRSIKDRSGTALLSSVVAMLKEIFRQASYMLRERPSAVIGFGGYGAASTYIAAAILGVKVIVHESNRKSGSCNRLAAIFSRKILCNDSGCDLYIKYRRKSVAIGTPVDVFNSVEERKNKMHEFLVKYNLKEDAKYLLVFGGSQGAKIINDFIDMYKDKLLSLDSNLNIIHIFGKKFPERENLIKERYISVPYIEDMRAVLALTTLSISRAGGGTCADMVEYMIPAIYVPYPHGNREQYDNAARIVDAGGGRIVENSHLESSHKDIVSMLQKLLSEENTLAKMRASLKSLKENGNSTDKFVEIIENIALN